MRLSKPQPRPRPDEWASPDPVDSREAWRASGLEPPRESAGVRRLDTRRGPVLFGVTLGPVPLVAIAALYAVISFTEGNVMVPAIEGRSFALPAAIVAPAIAIGLILGGAFGAVLALPVTSAARDVYLYVFRRSTGLSVEDAMEGVGSSAT